MSNKSWIVNKFGGLSVGSHANQIPSIVKDQLNKGFRVGVVCSARSLPPHATRSTTSRLLLLLKNVEKGSMPWKSTLDEVNEIFEEHFKMIEEHVQNSAIAIPIRTTLEEERKKLIFLLEALQVLGETSDKSLDLVLSIGERLASIIISGILEQNGVKARHIDLSRALNGDEKADYFKMRDNLSTFIMDELNKKEEKEVEYRVIVMSGFIGTFPNGLISTVGRGYSDLTATLLSLALEADHLDVWKPIDGIYSANPKLVPDARILDEVTTEEAFELTYYGTEAMHPLAIEVASKSELPIWVRNITKGNDESNRGTLISKRKGKLSEHIKEGTLATAVCLKEGVIVMNVHSNRKSRSHDFLRKVFSTLNKYHLIVDLVATSEVHVSLALSNYSEEKLQASISDLSNVGTVNILEDQVIVSLVGGQMKHRPGVAKAFFHALSSAGANIEMISQGSSEINISAVTSKQHAQQALKAIHQLLLDDHQINN